MALFSNFTNPSGLFLFRSTDTPPTATPQISLSKAPTSKPHLFCYSPHYTIFTDAPLSGGFLIYSKSLQFVFCDAWGFLILLSKSTSIAVHFFYKSYFFLFTILSLFGFKNINSTIFTGWVKHQKSMMFWFLIRIEMLCPHWKWIASNCNFSSFPKERGGASKDNQILKHDKWQQQKKFMNYFTFDRV